MKYKASSRPALTDLDLEVDKGEFAFLIGPSGSGKSTFFRLLLKEDRPTKGEAVSYTHLTLPTNREV